MKTKRFNKIAIIALLLVVVITLSLFINQLALPLKTYAEEARTVVGEEYFYTVRSSAIYNIGLSDLSEKEKEEYDKIPDEDEDGKKEFLESYNLKKNRFEQWAFQKDDNNFNYIGASKIASLKDERYGISLGEEAEKITLKKEKSTNEEGKSEYGEVIGPNITSQSTLTVFTYGQGAKFAQWSNNGINDKYSDFAYDPNSMIEVLRRQTNADVYVAKTMAFNIDIENRYNCLFQIQLNEQDKAPLLLYKLEANKDSYEMLGNTITSETSNLVSKIEDMTKHNIIIFDSNEAYQYHDFVYNELNILLTQISYDYLLHIGQVPKISMVSHSTGGVWNMMWANKHPLNVDALYAIAAPFNGAPLGHYLYVDGDDLANVIPSEDFSKGAVTNPSGLNNIDKDRYNKLNEDWNNYAIKVNPKLSCYAFTGMTSLDLIYDAVLDGNISDNWEYVLTKVSGQMQIALIVLLVRVATLVASWITAGVIVLAEVFHKLGLEEESTKLMNVLTSVWDEVVKEISDIAEKYGDLLWYVIRNLMIDKNGELVLLDDCTVGCYSALGLYSDVDSNALAQKQYENFNRFVLKTYRTDNCDITRKNYSGPAVPHNLEVQDADMIKLVTDNFEKQAGYNQEISNTIGMSVNKYEPETRYEYEELEDDTVCITKIKSGFYNDHIIIPAKIQGKPVSQIDDYATQGLDLDEIKSLEMSETIKHIGNYAFADMSSLSTVKLNSGLQYIGSGAFQFTAIESVDLFSKIEEIGSSAFANTNLNRVNLISSCNCMDEYNKQKEEEGNETDKIECDCQNLKKCPCEEYHKKECDCRSRLHFVGEGAFANTPFIDDADAENIIFGKVLIKYKSKEENFKLSKDDEIKYFAEKCFEGSAIKTLDISEFKFEDNTIPDYFLYGAENLENVIFPEGIVIIGKGAFGCTTSLEKMAIPTTVEIIGVEAFAFSGIIDLTIDSGYPLNISETTTFNGCSANLSIWLKSFAIKDYKNAWGVTENSALDKAIKTHTSTLSYFENENDIESLKDFNGVEYFSYLIDNYYSYAKDGYEFLCWRDAKGNDYYKGSILQFEYNEGEVWKLYAVMSEINYNVYFETYGGFNNNKIEYITIQDSQQLEKAEKTGYDFRGWFNNANFNGEEIITLANINHDIKLYAKFEPVQGFINYDTTDLIVERTSDKFTFGERFNAPVPEKTGYAFAGWYTNEGERITGINGVSIKKCKFVEDVTLYAHWTAKSFVIEYNDGENSYVLGDNGLTSDAGSVIVGEKIDVNNRALAKSFQKEGYIFDHFEDEKGRVIDFSNGIPDLGKNFSTFTICPKFVAEEYIFTIYDGFGGEPKKYTVSYDGIYDFDISVDGYELIGFEDKNGLVFEDKTGVILQDFTPTVESNGSFILQAVWNPIKGNVTFDSTGGTKVTVSSDYTAKYGETLSNIVIPKRNGYRFLGFYDSEGTQFIEDNGAGINDWNKTDPFVTLYAHWDLVINKVSFYDISYDGSEIQIGESEFNVEKPIKLPTSGFKKVGYTLLGWYIDKFQSEMIDNTVGKFEDFKVYANWSENKYTIISSREITISTNNRSIRLDNIGTSISYRKITLTKSVTDILLSYTSSVKLVIISEADNLNLYLNNANFSSLDGSPAIKGNNINIVVNGNCTITGGNGSNGVDGSKGADGESHGNPSNSTTYADSGKTGNKGGDGGDGFVAVKAISLVISGSENDKLTLIGGNGGNGGRGGNGGNGAYGNDGETGGGKSNGVSGGNGGDGGKGGDGGNGAYAIQSDSFTCHLKNLTLYGGNGGRAGDGGNGGKGGYGGKGANNPGFLFFTSNFAGAGGNGGNGGNGGEAGIAGKKAEYTEGTPYISGSDGDSGNMGKGGAKGLGGSGGDGPIGGANGSEGKNGNP